VKEELKGRGSKKGKLRECTRVRISFYDRRYGVEKKNGINMKKKKFQKMDLKPSKPNVHGHFQSRLDGVKSKT
jgi:hypothetical protein